MKRDRTWLVVLGICGAMLGVFLGALTLGVLLQWDHSAWEEFGNGLMEGFLLSLIR